MCQTGKKSPSWRHTVGILGATSQGFPYPQVFLPHPDHLQPEMAEGLDFRDHRKRMLWYLASENSGYIFICRSPFYWWKSQDRDDVGKASFSLECPRSTMLDEVPKYVASLGNMESWCSRKQEPRWERGIAWPTTSLAQSRDVLPFHLPPTLSSMHITFPITRGSQSLPFRQVFKVHSVLEPWSPLCPVLDKAQEPRGHHWVGNMVLSCWAYRSGLCPVKHPRKEEKEGSENCLGKQIEWVNHCS